MKVSVITINYNHSKQLEATIRSVVGNAKMLGNAFEEEVEYIVIDGGSTDSSACVIRNIFLIGLVKQTMAYIML